MARPKPDAKKVREAQALRALGLSYRNISAEMKSDVKTVWRWCHYDLARLAEEDS